MFDKAASKSLFLLLAQSALLLQLLGGCNEASFRVDTGADGGSDTLADFGQREMYPDLIPPDTRPFELDRCGGGGALAFEDGTLAISGSTASLRNEYGIGVRCGGATAFDGPQRYYTVPLDRQATYRFTLVAGFAAVAYLFSSCGVNSINADCGTAGDSGFLLGPLTAEEPRSVVFTPPSSGDYEIAIDGMGDGGNFTLKVETFAEPENGRCAGAEVVPLQEGKAKLSATTLGAKNEFGEGITCGTGLPFVGPQRYYRVALEGGKGYVLSLHADHPAALYLFGAAGACEQANLEVDCGSLIGTVATSIDAHRPVSTLFTPVADGDYIIAVDSVLPSAAGEFELTLEQQQVGGAMTCVGAEELDLSAGLRVVSGTTAGLFNDRGALMTCGGAPLLGPQQYYRVTLEQGPYTFRLSPTFDATVAVGTSCVDFPADCSSAGISGDALRVSKNTSGVLRFTPPAKGPYLVVVDSDDAHVAGSFSLQVDAATPPENGSCGSPTTQTLPALVEGDTGLYAPELPGISCGSSSGPFSGPQAYYRFVVPAGKSLELTLTPEGSFDPALYAFAAATPCDASSIELACQTYVADGKGSAIVERLTLPADAAEQQWIVVVDSWSPSEVGRFALAATLGSP